MQPMINMDRIFDIQDRIRDIQQQIGTLQQMPGMDFAEKLQKEIQRAQKGSANGTNRMNTIQEAQQAATNPQTAGKTADKVGGTGRWNENVVPASYGNGTRSGGNTSSGGAELDRLISSAAAKYQVDPKLVSAVAEAESGGDQSEISSAGAIGVMQLMPGTAAALGVDPYDKAQNVEGGAKYLRQMLDNFGGDLEKAVAAYNAGPNAVKRYGGVPPYAETQNYVQRVLDLYR